MHANTCVPLDNSICYLLLEVMLLVSYLYPYLDPQLHLLPAAVCTTPRKPRVQQ